jgi:hypothetical protein
VDGEVVHVGERGENPFELREASQRGLSVSRCS